MNESKTIRDTNIELLRIISMLMIVTLHYLNGKMGGVLDNVAIDEPNYYISHIIESICIIGPNVFVAISAYFMANTEKIKIRKIVDLYSQMVFWALLFWVLTVAFSINSFSLKETALVFAPFLGGRRWFVETYILLMLFAPFINMLIRNLEKYSFLTLIVIWTLVYSMWPSFLPSAPNTDNGYGLANFITIYLIVGYIRRYFDMNIINRKRKLFFVLWVTSMVFTILMSVAPGMFGEDSIITKICGKQWNYDYILNIVSAVSAFLFFKTIHMKPSRVINYIAGTTFGVFLIHSDFCLWKIVYQDILHCNAVYHSLLFIPHLLISVIVLFVCSSLFEIARKKIWECTIDKVLNHCKLINKVMEIRTNEGD